MRRRKLSPQETAANAAAREKRSNLAMHCQCCLRDILANTGRIAHHGYERPGWGYQTNSCFGAKRLPWEVDREALGELIGFMRERLRSMQDRLRNLRKESIPCPFYYSTYLLGRSEQKVAVMTRESFDSDKVAHKIETYLRRVSVATFDDLLSREVEDSERKIKNLSADIKHQQGRYEGWKQTHERVGERWQKL